METKDNCFLCMSMISNGLRARRVLIPPAYTLNSNDFFPLVHRQAHTHTLDRYSITSYAQPCAHCCNFLLTELRQAGRAATAVDSSQEKRNEIELVSETSDVELDRCHNKHAF